MTQIQINTAAIGKMETMKSVTEKLKDRSLKRFYLESQDHCRNLHAKHF